MAMKEKKDPKAENKKVYFYTKGAAPTDAETAVAKEIAKDFDVFIRNGTAMTGSPEKGKAHVGNVPEYFDEIENFEKLYGAIDRKEFKDKEKPKAAAAPAG